MASSALVGRIKRRWYLLVLGIVATTVAAVAIGQVVPPRYEAGAVVLLLPPPVPVERMNTPEAGNPLLRLEGLRIAATALVNAMQDAAVVEAIAPAGGSAQYSIQLDASSSAPLLTIVASDTTRDGALAVRDATIQAVPARLNEVQADVGVDAAWYITSTVIASDPEAELNTRQQTRAIIALLVAGIASTLGLVVAVDVALTARRKRGRRMASAGPETRPLPRGALERDEPARTLLERT